MDQNHHCNHTFHMFSSSAAALEVVAVCVSVCVFSLVAPVQPDGDVSLDVSALVLCQVT